MKRAKECISLMKGLMYEDEREKMNERIIQLKSRRDYNLKQPFENCLVLRLMGFNFR